MKTKMSDEELAVGLLKPWNIFIKPSCRRQDYLTTLSTTKLIKIAERVIGNHINVYSASEDIYNEMIRRLKVTAKNEQFIGKLCKDEPKQ